MSHAATLGPDRVGCLAFAAQLRSVAIVRSSVVWVSEAVRGEGAYLKDVNGRRFMSTEDSRAELAPRDIVARAILSCRFWRGPPEPSRIVTHINFHPSNPGSLSVFHKPALMFGQLHEPLCVGSQAQGCKRLS